MRILLAALVPWALTACTAEDRRRSAPPPAQAPAALADATQGALAQELDAAERHGTYHEVKARWQGQRVRWTVTHHAAFCRSEAACNVAAFPIQRPAQRGWLPALELAPGQFAALQARCGNASPCEVTVEGTLGKLEVSDAMPTSVTLTGVTLATK